MSEPTIKELKDRCEELRIERDGLKKALRMARQERETWKLCYDGLQQSLHVIAKAAGLDPHPR